MITNYCTVICFIMIGVNLIIIYSKLKEMDRLYRSWREHTLHLEKLINDLYARQRDDIHNLGRAFGRIQALEERLEGQEVLTANLEEKLDDHLTGFESPEFPDPEDEGIII